MKNKFALFVIIIGSFCSCKQEPRSTLMLEETKYADSLYSQRFDSLRKTTKVICDSLYNQTLIITMDSLKPIRLKEIDELFEQ